MGTIFTQVNNGTLKTYIQGESREIFRNSRYLIERAKAKGFKLTQRKAGNSGVGLTYAGNGYKVLIQICYTELEVMMFKSNHKI